MSGLVEMSGDGVWVDPAVLSQSCWKNLWAVRATNGDVRVVLAESVYGAREMFQIAGFKPFGWMEETLRHHLVPGVPRQILFISSNGFLFADQYTTDWTRKTETQKEWEAYLAGQEFPRGEHRPSSLSFDAEIDDPYDETGISAHG